jgi:hypothetical protein
MADTDSQSNICRVLHPTNLLTSPYLRCVLKLLGLADWLAVRGPANGKATAELRQLEAKMKYPIMTCMVSQASPRRIPRLGSHKGTANGWFMFLLHIIARGDAQHRLITARLNRFGQDNQQTGPNLVRTPTSQPCEGIRCTPGAEASSVPALCGCFVHNAHNGPTPWTPGSPLTNPAVSSPKVINQGTNGLRSICHRGFWNASRQLVKSVPPKLELRRTPMILIRMPLGKINATRKNLKVLETIGSDLDNPGYPQSPAHTNKTS